MGVITGTIQYDPSKELVLPLTLSLGVDRPLACRKQHTTARNTSHRILIYRLHVILMAY